MKQFIFRCLAKFALAPKYWKHPAVTELRLGCTFPTCKAQMVLHSSHRQNAVNLALLANEPATSSGITAGLSLPWRTITLLKGLYLFSLLPLCFGPIFAPKMLTFSCGQISLSFFLAFRVTCSCLHSQYSELSPSTTLDTETQPQISQNSLPHCFSR